MDPEYRFVPISSVSPRAQKICVPHFFLDILLEDLTTGVFFHFHPNSDDTTWIRCQCCESQLQNLPNSLLVLG